MKLASNEGAFGPLPAAVAAFEAAVAQLNRYPGRRRRAAARGAGRAARPGGRAGRARERGGRADPPLRRGHARPGRRGGLPVAVVPELRRAAARCGGAEPVPVPLAGRAADLDGLLEAARRPRTKLVYLANPNNPTGVAARARPTCAASSTSFPRASSACSTRPTPSTPTRSPRGRRCCARGAAAVRPAHVLEGLRAGRAAGRATRSPRRDVADALDRVRPIFNVNQPAQEAALASLGEERRGRAAGRPRPRGRASSCARRSPAPGSTRSPRRRTSSTRTCRTATAPALADRLLREGASSCASCTGFGAPARSA